MADRVLMDARFMSNPEPIENALERLMKVDVVQFRSLNATDARLRSGIIGQTAIEQGIDGAEADGMGHVRVDLARLVPTMIAAIQELAAKVEPKKKPARAKKVEEAEPEVEAKAEEKPVEAPAE